MQTIDEILEIAQYSLDKEAKRTMLNARLCALTRAHYNSCAPYARMMGVGEPDVPYGVRDFKAEFGGEMVEHGRFLHVAKPWLYTIGTWGVKILKQI